MSTTILVLQVILSVIITLFVLLQAQGTGLGSTWGGGGETYHTRRGLERAIFYATMVAIGLFILTSLLSVSR